MPELPEVEIVRRGLLPELVGRRITGVVVREPRLRWPVTPGLERLLAGRPLAGLHRRGKYLLFDFGAGHLLAHLGMSGSLRLVSAHTPPRPHDHVDLIFGERALRLHDPRRFGALLWQPGEASKHPLIAPLGVEPLEDRLTPEWLYEATRGRRCAVKLFVMDSHIIAGIGNIYASESLFRARIHPATPAGRLSATRCARLVPAIRDTLEAAIAAGGSTLRDYVHSDGSPGWFQQQYFVYGREGEECRVCARPVRAARQGQRSTFYCPRCQR